MRQVKTDRKSVSDDLSVVRGPDGLDATRQSEPEA
jgi:hypothetical protein